MEPPAPPPLRPSATLDASAPGWAGSLVRDIINGVAGRVQTLMRLNINSISIAKEMRDLKQARALLASRGLCLRLELFSRGWHFQHTPNSVWTNVNALKHNDRGEEVIKRHMAMESKFSVAA